MTLPVADLDYLRHLLTAHQPADEQERRDTATLLDLLTTQPAVISQHNPTGHITASALVIDPHARRFLLHYHKSLDRWLQFGGHLEDDETDPAQAALREAREESGLLDLAFFPALITGERPHPLDLDIHMIPEKGARIAHPHFDWRYLVATQMPESLTAIEGESQTFRWITFAAYLNDQAGPLNLDPALTRLIRKAARLLS